MTVDACISALQSTLSILSDARPTGSFTLTPYLTTSRPSARYTQVNIYKQLLKRFDDTQALLTQLSDCFREIETELERERKAVQNPLAPIHSLPSECMREIFLCLAYGSMYCDAGRVLSRVCSSWRSVCLSVPEVWTHVRDYDTSLRMITLNQNRAHKLPLRITVSHNLDNLAELESTEGMSDDALDVIQSVRIVLPNASQSGKDNPRFIMTQELEETVVCGVKSERWLLPVSTLAGDKNADRLLSISGDVLPQCLQVHGCDIDLDGSFTSGPQELVLSNVTLDDARQIYERIGRVASSLHLHQICCDRPGNTDYLADRFADSLVEYGIPASLILNECLPALVIAWIDRVVFSDTEQQIEMEDLQVILPDVRLESQTVIDSLKGSLQKLPKILWSRPYAVAISAPLHWIFDILEETIKQRSKRPTDAVLFHLSLRLTVPQWSKPNDVDCTQILGVRWQAIRELVSPIFRRESMRLSLVMTDSLMGGYEDVARLFCEEVILHPEGDEHTVDYSYAMYPREHYAFTK